MKKTNKPLVHPNIIGPKETKQLHNLMDQIRNGDVKHDQAEVDRLHKLYETGPYSRSYRPELLKQALQQVADNHTHTNLTRNRRLVGTGLGSGKKQMEAEYQKLILELENG